MKKHLLFTIFGLFLLGTISLNSQTLDKVAEKSFWGPVYDGMQIGVDLANSKILEQPKDKRKFLELTVLVKNNSSEARYSEDYGLLRGFSFCDAERKFEIISSISHQADHGSMYSTEFPPGRAKYIKIMVDPTEFAQALGKNRVVLCGKFYTADWKKVASVYSDRLAAIPKDPRFDLR